MRTPAQIAHMLGWPPEKPRRGAYGMVIPDGLCGAYTADEGGEWWCRRALGHGGSHAPNAEATVTVWCGDTPVRVPAEQMPKVKLHIRKDRGTGTWRWDVWEGCRHHGGDEATTQPAALALGLAALETATVRSGQ